MVYNPKETPLDTNDCVLAIGFSTIKSAKQFESQVEQLKYFLKSYALPSDIKIEKFDNNKKTLVVVANKFWQETTFNISLFSYLLKSICWELDHTKSLLDAIKETKTNGRFTKESKYLDNNVKENLEKVLPKLIILTEKHKNPEGYEVKQETYTVHNRSGFNFNCRWTGQGTVISDWLKEQQ